MARLIAPNGATVNVSDEKAARLSGQGYNPADASKFEADASTYGGMKVADLKAEIESRNEGRDEADLLSSEGKRADLVAALKADDAASGNPDE